MDPKTGLEAWERITSGNTSNLIWEKESDSIVYGDGTGIHVLARASGRTLKEIAFDSKQQQFSLRLCNPQMAVAISDFGVFVFNFRAGAQKFAEGKLKAFYSPYSFLNQWPLPENGQELDSPDARRSLNDNWEQIQERTLLPAPALDRLKAYFNLIEGSGDAYETEITTGQRKVWWIDPQTGARKEFHVDGEQHDASRALGMIFVVDKNELQGFGIP